VIPVLLLGNFQYAGVADPLAWFRCSAQPCLLTMCMPYLWMAWASKRGAMLTPAVRAAKVALSALARRTAVRNDLFSTSGSSDKVVASVRTRSDPSGLW
jgi:hypothetical protein